MGANNGADANNEETKSTGGSRHSKAELLDKVLETVEKKVVAGDVKATLGDLVRLWQLERELADEQPKEIKVQWIEPEEPERPASGE